MVLALGLSARSLLRGRRIFLMLPHRLRCGRMDPSVRKPTCRARHPSGALPRSRCTCLRKSGLTTASSSITTSALRGSAEVTTSVKLLHRPSSPSVSVESTRHARPSAGPYAEKRETGNRHRWAWICWRRQRSLRWSKLITTKAMAGAWTRSSASQSFGRASGMEAAVQPLSLVTSAACTMRADGGRGPSRRHSADG